MQPFIDLYRDKQHFFLAVLHSTIIEREHQTVFYWTYLNYETIVDCFKPYIAKYACQALWVNSNV